MPHWQLMTNVKRSPNEGVSTLRFEILPSYSFHDVLSHAVSVLSAICSLSESSYSSSGSSAICTSLESSSSSSSSSARLLAT